MLARGDETARLAGLLLEYHRREAKPVWWAFFDRQEKTSSELIEDAESIGGLEWDGEEPEASKKSLIYTFSFPTQQHKLDAGDEVVDPGHGQERWDDRRARRCRRLAEAQARAEAFEGLRCRRR